MDKRRTNRTRETGEEDNSAGTGPASLAEDAEVPQVAQQTPQQPEEWPPFGDGLRVAHSRLAELLYATDSTLEEINCAGLGAVGQRGDDRRSTAVPTIETTPRFEFAAMGGAGAETTWITVANQWPLRHHRWKGTARINQQAPHHHRRTSAPVPMAMALTAGSGCWERSHRSNNACMS
ncbi:unnamed protein product [Lampetra planeri]